MIGQIEQTFLTEATKITTKLLFDGIKQILLNRAVPGTADDAIKSHISNHLIRVANWASTYNFLGLGSPKESDRDTIGLRFNTAARRYRGKSSSNLVEVGEDNFLADGYSVLLLGDPGAGKTTTLKRIIITLLTSDKVSPTDFYPGSHPHIT